MRRFACLVGVAAAVALAAPMAAQTVDQSTPIEYVTVTSVTVKPEAVSDFEEYAKQVLEAARKSGMKSRWDGYQMLHGGSPFQYTFVTGHSSMADLENAPLAPMLLRKAFGEKEGMRIMSEGRTTIESVETAVLRYHHDLSINAQAPGDAKYIHGIALSVKPDMMDEHREWSEKIKTAAEKATGTPTVLHHSLVFGEGPNHVIVLPFNSWAEYDKWKSVDDVLTEAYGDAEAKRLMEMRDRTRDRIMHWVVQHRPDLSYVPGTS